MLITTGKVNGGVIQVSKSGVQRPIPEVPLPTPPGFSALTKAEKVRYLQALWDQISADPGALPVPENHLRLAEERLKRYREDPSRGRDAFEVLDRSISISSAGARPKTFA